MRYTDYSVDAKLAKKYHDAAFNEFGGGDLFVALSEHEEKKKGQE